MTTTVTKTIGASGCDYTTVQSWFNACPADLTSSDQIWKGVLKNEEFVVTGPVLVASGKTTDDTRYVWLTTDTGCSFKDNANVRTNALRYNASNGAALRNNGSYSGGNGALDLQLTKFRMTGVQVANDDTSVQAVYAEIGSVLFEDCIIESSGNSTRMAYFYNGSVCKNTLFVMMKSGAAQHMQASNSNFYNCTFVTPSDITATGVSLYGGGVGYPVLENCAVFGASSVYSGTSPTVTTCYTDVGSPPSGFTQTTYSNAFESTSNSTRDFRLKSGSALIDTGTTDSTNSPSDITGTARPVGSAYDVGVWEYGAASTPQYLRPSSIITSGSWTASAGTLATAIDETSADDADYDTTTNLSSDMMEIKFSAGGDPASSSGHKVRYRIKGSGGAGITVALYQGATLKAGPWTHDPADGSFTTYTQTLSSGEADSLTDYTDLRLRFTSTT